MERISFTEHVFNIYSLGYKQLNFSLEVNLHMKRIFHDYTTQDVILASKLIHNELTQ